MVYCQWGGNPEPFNHVKLSWTIGKAEWFQSLLFWFYDQEMEMTRMYLSMLLKTLHIYSKLFSLSVRNVGFRRINWLLFGEQTLLLAIYDSTLRGCNKISFSSLLNWLQGKAAMETTSKLLCTSMILSYMIVILISWLYKFPTPPPPLQKKIYLRPIRKVKDKIY